MVKESDYGRGFKDGIKDTTRRIEEGKRMARRMEKERIIEIIKGIPNLEINYQILLDAICEESEGEE